MIVMSPSKKAGKWHHGLSFAPRSKNSLKKQAALHSINNIDDQLACGPI